MSGNLNDNLDSRNDQTASTSGSNYKTKSGKPVARCASILLRSKGLILSDSDSEEIDESPEHKRANESIESGHQASSLSISRKHRMKKQKRKTDKAENQLSIASYNHNQYFGKRKRSTSLFSHSVEDASGSTNENKTGNVNESHLPADVTTNRQQKMDCDSQSYDSSSLSESLYSSDQFFDADDEQSDFYEVISRTGHQQKVSSANQKYQKQGKSKYHTSIPIPKNPFASVPSTPSSSCNSSNCLSSALIWKRRRKNH